MGAAPRRRVESRKGQVGWGSWHSSPKLNCITASHYTDSRAVGNSVVSEHGDSIHWLDNGTEHPHRVAFSVENSVMDRVMKRLKQGFDQQGIQVLIWLLLVFRITESFAESKKFFVEIVLMPCSPRLE